MGHYSHLGLYQQDDAESSTHHLLDANKDVYTKDGTVNYLNNPADKRTTGTWKACRFILGNECCERLAYFGMSSNLLLYFTHQLNQHNATASRNLSIWAGTCYTTPLIGAFVADAYLGRYWTIASFSMIYALGMALLTLSATIPGFKPTCYEKDICVATDIQSAVCFTALYLVALGTGGIKPCVSSYGADQFDDDDEVEEKSKSSFFNWFYFSINVGSLVAHTVLVWIQDNVGWGWGFGIPTAAMAISLVSFFSGTKLYRNQRALGSPLISLCQVVVASLRKKSIEVPSDTSLLYDTTEDADSAVLGSRKFDHTEQLSFFDKAAVETPSDSVKGSIDSWRLCSVTQVEELKSVVGLLPIWATGIILYCVNDQVNNLFVLQGSTLDPCLGSSTFKISPASLGAVNIISILFLIPVYDWIIVPIARKFTGQRNGLTQLQRIGTGLFISILSMLSAGTLEVIRLEIVRTNNYYELKHVPLSIFWQVPQYFLIGFFNVFTYVGQLEFFYSQAPDSMKSMCSALSLTAIALGSYMSSLLVTIVTNITTRDGSPGWIPDNLNYGHLQNFFWLLAILSMLNLVVFLLLAKRHTHRKPVGALR